jgi:RNA polymerase sigma factor (TIGR02999 family)
LWTAAYDDLKQLARSRLRVSRDFTYLDTTGLVSEAYARLAHMDALKFVSRAQFLSYCSRVMRSIIVDLVREMQAQQREGDQHRVTLSTAIGESVANENDPLRVDDALEDLAKFEPRLAQVVEMRYFGGYTEAEVAEALDLTVRTVQRDWQKARMLLRTMLAAT